jgi:hypothetical protein
MHATLRAAPPLLALAALVALLALAAPRPAAGAQAPGAPAIAQAGELAREWGRCPTARPAHRALARAVRTRAPRPRVLRARAALRAWRQVARECTRPVPLPTVSPEA